MCLPIEGSERSLRFTSHSNSHYLLDFMKLVGDGNVKFNFKAASSAGEFCPEDGDAQYKFRYIVMPMRP